MTNDELAEYYAKLLIIQYRGKPKAFASVKELALLAISNQLTAQVQDAFNVDTAVGVQLDTIGKYAGASRNGFDFVGPVTLGDDDYRTLIKVAILENNAGSSLSDIQELIQVFFAGTLYVFDYLGMRMSYFMDSSIGSLTLAEFFVRQGRLPKPMGVQLGALIFGSPINNFFGMRTYGHAAVNAHGFNTYTVYDTDAPWLSYSNAVIF